MTGKFPNTMRVIVNKIQGRARRLWTNGWIWFYNQSVSVRSVLRTQPIVCDKDEYFELHTLTCERDFLSTVWSLKTFYNFSGLRPRLVIYDDGSLSQRAIHIISAHFVGCRIIRRDRFHQDMEDFLGDYRESMKYYKIKSFYCALKFFGPMFYAKSEYVLYIDSDVLFFKKPVEMLQHIERKSPFYMSDSRDFYSYPVEFLNTLFKIDLAHCVNAGLFCLSKKDFVGSMDLVESYFKKASELGTRRGWINFHEQTLAAILLSKANAVRLGEDYQISKNPLTEKTVSHHFVNDGSRVNFYRAGLRRLALKGFIEENCASKAS